jgi:hypothetical protein
MVTTVPKEQVLSKLMNYVQLRQCELLISLKKAICSGFGARRLAQVNGTVLDCSRQPTRQSFVKSSTLFHFVSDKVTIIPLTPHPNDPENRASQAIDHLKM